MSTAKEIDDAMKSLQEGLERLQKSAIAFETTTDGVSQSDRRGEEAAIKALEAQNKLIADSAGSSDEMKAAAADVLKSIKKQNKLLKEQYK